MKQRWQSQTLSTKSEASSKNLNETDWRTLSELFGRLGSQVSILSDTMVPDPFEDHPESAMDTIRKNLGVFMVVIAASGSAKIDLIALIKKHQEDQAAIIKAKL